MSLSGLFCLFSWIASFSFPFPLKDDPSKVSSEALPVVHHNIIGCVRKHANTSPLNHKGHPDPTEASINSHAPSKQPNESPLSRK